MPSAPSKKTPCALEGCTRAELWSAKCRNCHLTFCLGHRHPPDHECSALAESRRLQREKEQAVKDLRAQFKAPAAAVSKTKKSSPVVELMKLKGTATGDKAVPLESRVYFRVHFPRESNLGSQPMYFHKDWTIGRAIDAIANYGKIINRNNEASPETRLSLHHGESGTVILTTARFVTLMAAPDKSLSNGCHLILERGGMESVDPASYSS
ncbi:AN1-type zinc finger protein 1 [Geranomyces variabilis]|uniref:AN1-type zinc finger protein 1 n=1 Tax=Geranomyces variabilis TaxID=109894 RepID=A0AAD5XQ15_9FUNG|nr:AN1-type zinc finger protein 1 [Geranomyces variabilis]